MNIKNNLKKTACGALSVAMLLAAAPNFTFAKTLTNLGGCETDFATLDFAKNMKIATKTVCGINGNTNQYAHSATTISADTAKEIPAGANITWDGSVLKCDGVEISKDALTLNNGTTCVKNEKGDKFYVWGTQGWGTAIGKDNIDATEGYQFLAATVVKVKDTEYLMKNAGDDYSIYKIGEKPEKLKSVKRVCGSEGKKASVELNADNYTVETLKKDASNEVKIKETKSTASGRVGTEFSIEDVDAFRVLDDNGNTVYTGKVGDLPNTNKEEDLFHNNNKVTIRTKGNNISEDTVKGHTWDYEATIGQKGGTVSAQVIADFVDNDGHTSTGYKSGTANLSAKFINADENGNPDGTEAEDDDILFVGGEALTSQDGDSYTYTIEVKNNVTVEKETVKFVQFYHNGQAIELVKVTIKPEYTAEPKADDDKTPANDDKTPADDNQTPADDNKTPADENKADANADADAKDANAEADAKENGAAASTTKGATATTVAANKKTGDEVNTIFGTLGAMIVAVGAFIKARKKKDEE